jgi:hypothetical protein
LVLAVRFEGDYENMRKHISNDLESPEDIPSMKYDALENNPSVSVSGP